MKSAIIIGASSGIGRALAMTLSRDGYRLGLAARRTELLAQLRDELPGPCVLETLDVTRPDLAMPLLRKLIDELHDVELFVISAGTGSDNPTLEWEPERETIAVNVLGFAGMVNVAVAHLESRGSGHLVGITSLAGLRGIGGAPAYAASKAFASNYLQGMRYRFTKRNLPVVVTDVQPGFVDTRMASADGRFWVASPDEAARQIAAALRRRRRHVYITRRWRLIAWLVRMVPDAVYGRM